MMNIRYILARVSSISELEVAHVATADEARQKLTGAIMVITAKHLTHSDIVQLDGHVSTILRKGTTGATDLVGQIQVIVNKRALKA